MISLPKLVVLDLSCNSLDGTGSAIASGLQASTDQSPLQLLWLQGNDLILDGLNATTLTSTLSAELLNGGRRELLSLNVLNNTVRSVEGGGGLGRLGRPNASAKREWPAFDFDDPALSGGASTNGSNVSYTLVGDYVPRGGQAVANALDAMILDPPAGFRRVPRNRALSSGRCSAALTVSAYQCGSMLVWGGYGQFAGEDIARAEFDTSETHATLRLRLAIVSMDWWGDNDELVATVDGREVWRLGIGMIPARLK